MLERIRYDANCHATHSRTRGVRMPDLLCRFCAVGLCVHLERPDGEYSGETHNVPAVVIDNGWSMCADCAKLPAKPSEHSEIRDA